MKSPARFGLVLSTAALLVAACGPQSTPVSGADLIDHTAGLVVPGSVHLTPGADRSRSAQLVHTAQQLYTFWHTGDSSYLDRALSPDFRDNTLPSGRPQGPAGPRAASAGFRVAVPDLTCELADLYLTDDTLTAAWCSAVTSPAA
ncbi:SnoaL-like polyketide cyclase [Nocardia tenerifensis]|uniref:SnoaL-like polyketide cyclase n=1 Tax=Nocardia tenerifensis TaxID=228006 RepID=A0A318JNR7_9NOCA|nr:ester cyclase [Nocardia tenerifensis]PXX56548.1 SnoaL-like polyketide cyclase [Nocardia tenerifensis]